MTFLSSHSTAVLIARLASARNLATGDTRFQLSAKAIGDLAGRSIVDPHFMAQLSSDLLALDWIAFQVTDSSYAFIQTKAAQGFRKLSAEALLAFDQQADLPAATDSNNV